MKSNIDEKQASLVAGMLKQSLARHTDIHALEKQLASAGPEKRAGLGSFLAGIVPITLGYGTLLAGGALGGAAYGAHAGIDDSKDKLEEYDAVKRKVDLARRELETHIAAQQQQAAGNRGY